MLKMKSDKKLRMSEEYAHLEFFMTIKNIKVVTVTVRTTLSHRTK